jgi:hypothetical protein
MPGLGESVYNAVLSDGRTKVELISFPWVEKVRKLFKRPAAGQLIAVGLSNASEKNNLEALHTGPWSSTAFLQPLAWLDSPNINPFIFPDTEESEPNKCEPGELCSTHIKEIVFGEAEDRLAASRQLLRDLATHSFIPGLTTFGDPVQGYKSIPPAVRVLNSPSSALVFKVPDLEAACDDISRLVGFPVQTDSYSATSPSKADAFAHVPVPFLQGLSVRVSESEDFLSRYLEPAVSARMRQDNSVEFE